MANIFYKGKFHNVLQDPKKTSSTNKFKSIHFLTVSSKLELVYFTITTNSTILNLTLSNAMTDSSNYIVLIHLKKI